MKYKQDPRLNVNVPVGIADRKTPPALTVLISVLYIFIYYLYQSANKEMWISRNTFQFDQIVNLINNHNYGQICNILFLTNFSNLNLWQLLISIYFTSLFAIPVEKKIGPARFIILILLACTLPWIMQLIDIYHFPLWPFSFEHPKESTYFFGPYPIMLALSGAYTVLIPKKIRDISQSRLQRKDKTEIFNKAEKKAMNEKFGLSPDLFLAVFFLYVIGSHFIINYFYKDYDTICLSAGLAALITGLIQASFIRRGLEESYQEHPLKHAAVKYYYELVDLDVGHTTAIKGAAKELGLPDEQVEEWVKRTKGKLRPT